MADYRKKPGMVDAFQWSPDRRFGTFDGGRYKNKRVGYDGAGVEYTVTQVGVQTDRGFQKINPGDWIVTESDGHRHLRDAAEFEVAYEPLGDE